MGFSGDNLHNEKGLQPASNKPQLESYRFNRFKTDNPAQREKSQFRLRSRQRSYLRAVYLLHDFDPNSKAPPFRCVICLSVALRKPALRCDLL